jgi:hypothetical protein
MATGTEIQVTITPEAQAKIDELGRRAEFERTLEHAKQTIPGVVAIDVDAPWIHDYQDDSIVFLEVYAKPIPSFEEMRLQTDKFLRWQYQTFPVEVCATFRLGVSPLEANGR